MKKLFASAILLLAVAACATAPASLCHRQAWAPGDPLDSTDVVFWSALRQSLSPEPVDIAFAPYGDDLSADEVSATVREFGGHVLSVKDCVVVWRPGAAE